jgi:hypothetical protein
MDTAKVIKMPGRSKPAGKSFPRKSARFAKAMKRQAAAAIAVGGVAATLTALSLTHLAHGVQIVTNCPEWEGWAMGAVTDLGFVGLEIAQVVCATEKVRTEIKQWAPKAVSGMLVGSAAANAFAFASGAVGWMVAPAVAAGLAIPAFLYALTRVGTAMYVDCHSKG